MSDTVLTLFRRNALRFGDKPCFYFKSGKSWRAISWIDAEEKVRRYVLGLLELGLCSGDKVVIWGNTSVTWTFLDLAILAAGGVVVPIYPTLNKENVLHIMEDAKVSLIFLENDEWISSYKSEIESLGVNTILFDKVDATLVRKTSIPVNKYDEKINQLRYSDLASVIYTSGTTGVPKGAMITHGNIMAEIKGLQGVFHSFGEEFSSLMALPLAHVVARALQFFQLVQGCPTYFAEGISQLAQNLVETKPSYFVGVPRIFEKVYQAITTKVKKSPKVVRNLFEWAFSVGEKVSRLKQRKFPISFFLQLKYRLAYMLVFRKIHARLGGRVRYLISGGAPLKKEIAQFFHAAGLLILEGYGLTETSAALTINRIDDYRFGTVGKPLDGVRLKIAEDGEICAKGDVIFQGYLGLKEKTEAAFDEEGWYLTGDIGEFTKDGFLKITDRKKDIIITAGGKNVAPQSIENLIKGSPYIDQVVVFGDRRQYLCALLSLNEEAILDYAKSEGLEGVLGKELFKDPKIKELIGREIETANSRLASFETIKKFAILDRELSVEEGELTPTLKVKRKVVAEKFKPILDSLYLD